jgi:hypothetical protein
MVDAGKNPLADRRRVAAEEVDRKTFASIETWQEAPGRAFAFEAVGRLGDFGTGVGDCGARLRPLADGGPLRGAAMRSHAGRPKMTEEEKAKTERDLRQIFEDDCELERAERSQP